MILVNIWVFCPPTLHARECNKAKRGKGERELGPGTRCECIIDLKRRGVLVPHAVIELCTGSVYAV